VKESPGFITSRVNALIGNELRMLEAACSLKTSTKGGSWA